MYADQCLPRNIPFIVFTVEAQCTAVIDVEGVECNTDTSVQKLNTCDWQAKECQAVKKYLQYSVGTKFNNGNNVTSCLQSIQGLELLWMYMADLPCSQHVWSRVSRFTHTPLLQAWIGIIVEGPLLQHNGWLNIHHNRILCMVFAWLCRGPAEIKDQLCRALNLQLSCKVLSSVSCQ